MVSTVTCLRPLHEASEFGSFVRVPMRDEAAEKKKVVFLFDRPLPSLPRIPLTHTHTCFQIRTSWLSSPKLIALGERH
jgi:hypothetical protein